MRVINMAHGEMLMLGAYAAYVVEDRAYLGLNLYWALPVSFLAVGLVGYLLEICLIRFLYGRPLDTLLATWGVGLVLQQGVRMVFGPDLKPLSQPQILRHSLEYGDMTFPVYRLFVIAVTVVCLAGVYLLFYRTSFGLRVRAVTQNRAMASALGVSTRRVDALTFALGAALAGVAGCVVGHMYNVKSDMGIDYVIDAFMVVILGGVGQMAGTVAGGAIIGSGNSLVAKLLGNEPMAKVVVLLIVIAFIQFRPAGIFSPRERVYD
jgi:urea transport system permease protein